MLSGLACVSYTVVYLPTDIVNSFKRVGELLLSKRVCDCAQFCPHNVIDI